MTHVAAFWERLNSSFWFVPAVMAVVAVALSFLLIELDSLRGADRSHDPNALLTFGPEGARAILSVIASSMITVVSLIFSITMLSLQLASSQFGPRVLDNFMRDRTNQTVLGTFTSTFLYCLFVLRSVGGSGDASFVPDLAVAFAILLAAASVAVLIYFIHHIATSIRVERLLERLATESIAALHRIFPESAGRAPEDGAEDAAGQRLPLDFDRRCKPIEADSGGYVQSIGVESLLRTAAERDLVLRIVAPPGRFVTKGACVILAYPADRISDETDEDLRGSIVIGRNRTARQDLEFAIRRIVELAQRSLSPGINDPTTALYCIDRLGQILGRLASQGIPSPKRLDGDGRLRVLTETVVLEDVARHAFAAIARYGMGDPDVVIRLAETLEKLEASCPPPARAAIARLREQIVNAGLGSGTHLFDREVLSDFQGTNKTAI